MAPLKLYNSMSRLWQSSKDLNPFKILNERTALLKSTPCPQELEKKIGDGQLEECIVQAKYELDLAKRILEERAWEPLISEPPKNQWKWPL